MIQMLFYYMLFQIHLHIPICAHLLVLISCSCFWYLQLIYEYYQIRSIRVHNINLREGWAMSQGEYNVCCCIKKRPSTLAISPPPASTSAWATGAWKLTFMDPAETLAYYKRMLKFKGVGFIRGGGVFDPSEAGVRLDVDKATGDAAANQDLPLKIGPL